MFTLTGVVEEAILVVGLAVVIAGATTLLVGNPIDVHDPSQHHRATVEYRGTPCEEDEVLWWVEVEAPEGTLEASRGSQRTTLNPQGVRACTPLDSIQRR